MDRRRVVVGGVLHLGSLLQPAWESWSTTRTIQDDEQEEGIQ